MHVKNAMKWNANDPLAHMALGVTLLMGGRFSEARTAFVEAGVLAPDCAESLYGQGLVYLAEKRAKQAGEVLQRAKPTEDTTGLISYARTMAGSTQQTDWPNSSDDTCLALNALSLMRQQRFEDAAAIWSKIRGGSQPLTWKERSRLALTFLPARPLTLNSQPIKGNLGLPPKKNSGETHLAGTVALRADLSKTQSISMVAFFVDNELVGVTNRSPYEYMWDTKRVKNGQHTVKVVGTDSAGFQISEKTTTVSVRNSASVAAQQDTLDPGLQNAWAELRNLLIPKPSTAAVNYNLAKCALMTGNPYEAQAAFERVMALDPDYLDTRHSLAALLEKKRSGGKLYRAQTDKKVLALTFDDGPTADTPTILQILREKKAKATFFVVGKQAEAHPDLLKMIIDDGHEVQSHTYNHLALDFLKTGEIERELFRTRVVLRSIAGIEASLIRPPGGRSGRALDEVAERYGLTAVFWTANCTSLEGGRKEKMRDYIVSSARPGGIVLMHYGEGVTRRALPEAIDILRRQGYEFLKISELCGGTTERTE